MDRSRRQWIRKEGKNNSVKLIKVGMDSEAEEDDLIEFGDWLKEKVWSRKNTKIVGRGSLLNGQTLTPAFANVLGWQVEERKTRNVIMAH
jgi:hypothetical protein